VKLSLFAAAASVLMGCWHTAGTDDGWTVRQAESIRVIRGTPVNVRGCRGVGSAGSGRFERFACVAGARAPGDSRDTVAVLYELRALGPYDGARPRYALVNVRFVGGPGIP
jgi:hypothetical protein